MADEIREYVRAAQEAELRGDAAEAAELLTKAAHLYKSSGRASRAITMLRHALRLDDSRKDLEDEIRRLEWLPDQPMRRAIEGDESLEEEMKRILAPLEQAVEEAAQEATADILGAPLPGILPGKPPKAIPERAPTLAPEGQEAWCSFCCKPAREVGPLVSGVTGAFACPDCVRASARLLGLDEQTQPNVPVEEELAPPVEVMPVEPARFELPQQIAARRELEQQLGFGLRRVLLVGAAGAGKTALLNALAQEGKGRSLIGATVTAHPPDDELLLIDQVESLDAQGWTRLLIALERHPGPAVIALRGTSPEPAAFLLTEDARVGVPSTPELLEATGGRLPVDFAEQLDSVLVLETPDAQALEALARYLLSQRGVAPELATEVGPVLAQKALGSERGAHELVALVRRVPKGAWKLDGSAPASKKKRRQRKKAEP